VAAAAATKQPLTKRGVARSVAFFTSSTAPDEPDHPALPETDTLVQYMGGREAAATAERLLAEGRRRTCRWWWWKTAAAPTSASCA
jgi:uroporphyrin-III C-methyltransferase